MPLFDEDALKAELAKQQLDPALGSHALIIMGNEHGASVIVAATFHGGKATWEVQAMGTIDRHAQFTGEGRWFSGRLSHLPGFVNIPPTDHRLPTLFQRPDQVRDQLHVATVVYNSARYRTRWRHWQDWEKMVLESGALPYTLEIAFGARAFAITDPTNPRHFQMRTWDQMWFKEIGVDLVVSRMPADAQWIAYVDADSRPVRPDWANETIQQLQAHACVQMWSQYHCLDSHHNLSTTSHSFMNSYLQGWPTVPPKGASTGYPYEYPTPGKPKWPGPPGLAWAWRRDAWSEVGGLLECCILGSADWYMANGLIDRLTDNVVSKKFSPDYRAAIYDWQDKARVLRRDIGMVDGLWLHYWHGPMVKRGYATRNQILIDTQFSPVKHLKKDWQGLWSFTNQAPIELRDRIRQYLSARDEDAL